MSSGTITGFTTGGVAGLTTLEFEPGMVHHDLKCFEQRGKRERRMVCHLYLTLLSYPFFAKGW